MCLVPLSFAQLLQNNKRFGAVLGHIVKFGGTRRHEEVKPGVGCINRFPLFGCFERVVGPPVQECCSLKLRKVWLRHLKFPQFSRNFPQFSRKFPQFLRNFLQLDLTLPDRIPPPPRASLE